MVRRDHGRKRLSGRIIRFGSSPLHTSLLLLYQFVSAKHNPKQNQERKAADCERSRWIGGLVEDVSTYADSCENGDDQWLKVLFLHFTVASG
jgi:hypothetical protein